MLIEPRAALLLVAAVVGTAGPVRAQIVVPVAQEPMHHVVFENALVRVIDAAVPAGQETLYHVHGRDNVPVAIEGGRIALTQLAGPTIEKVVTVGDVSFAAAYYTHRVSNLTFSPVRFIDVELLAAAPRRTAGEATPTAHERVLDNDKVRVFRVRLDPGAALAAHTHAGPLLEVLVRGAVSRPVAPAGDPRELRPGGFSWHEDGIVPDSASMPGAREIVEIEWK